MSGIKTASPRDGVRQNERRHLPQHPQCSIPPAWSKTMPSEVILPASDRAQVLASNQFGPGKELAEWESRLLDHWYGMRFEEITLSETQDLR